MNIIYSSHFNEAYYRIIKRLLEDPQYIIDNTNGEILYELTDFAFELRMPHNCFATIREMSLDYLAGELEFYLSGSPFLKDISKHSKFWEKVTDDGRSINSNYGKLLLHDRNLHNYTQFEYARDCLLKNEQSKKAVMSIYSRENAFKSNDNPCTMYLQFLIRKDQLHLFVKMRSSDIWFGLPYDVPFFVLLQYRMLHELYNCNPAYRSIEIGCYNHQAGSLHLYDRNKEKVKKLIYSEGVSSEEVLEEDQTNLFDIFIKSRVPNWYEPPKLYREPYEPPKEEETEDLC